MGLEGILYRSIEDYQKNGYCIVFPLKLWDVIGSTGISTAYVVVG